MNERMVIKTAKSLNREKYMLDKLNKQIENLQEKENNLKHDNEILALVAFDRSVDFITLMTTNYTTEGMIDEKFGINFGRIKVKENMLKENLSKISEYFMALIEAIKCRFEKLYKAKKFLS